jgi:hypothetical protein
MPWRCGEIPAVEWAGSGALPLRRHTSHSTTSARGSILRGTLRPGQQLGVVSTERRAHRETEPFATDFDRLVQHPETRSCRMRHPANHPVSATNSLSSAVATSSTGATGSRPFIFTSHSWVGARLNSSSSIPVSCLSIRMPCRAPHSVSLLLSITYAALFLGLRDAMSNSHHIEDSREVYVSHCAADRNAHLFDLS